MILKYFATKIILVCLLVFSASCFAAIGSPIGKWQTVDDETGKPRSIVQVIEENGQLQGRIKEVFYRPGEGPSDVCAKCTGVFHNQPILGLTFLWGLIKEKDNSWGAGRVLDPHNGKIYRCKLTMSDDGQELSVRGYIGVPLLGRTQTWYRLS